MHPISVINWFDSIGYIDRSRKDHKNNDTSKRIDKLLKWICDLVSIILIPISLLKVKKRCSSSIFLLIFLVAVNYLLQNNAVSAATITKALSNQPIVQSNKPNGAHNLSNNSIRNSTSNHLRNQFFRTIRSIKLTNHRLKHRRSSSINLAKNYQSAKQHNWSVLGDQDAEYALKLLESEHLTSAILHFIEITYKYAEFNLPALQLANDTELNETETSQAGTKKYYNTGSCVQVKIDSLRDFLRPQSFAKYAKQAETAKRTASLLTTLLSERLEIKSDRNYIKNNFFTHNDTSNIVLHKAFFWSLLKVNLQSDSNLFANGIAFRPDLNQFPIELFSNLNANKEKDNQDHPNSTNKPFSPYIFRKKNGFRVKLPTSVELDDQNFNETNRTTYNYVNLAGVSSFQQRIVPNPNLKIVAADAHESMEEKTENLNKLKHLLVNKKQPEPYINTYSYSSDWYLHFANKYLNNSQSINYHELIKSDQGYWTVPYSDCSVTGSWLISFSVPFFGLSTESKDQIEFKGVVIISIDLSEQDINQCSDEDPFFPNTHKCDRETTDCIPMKGLGFRRGAYMCQCKSGFYIPNVKNQNSSERHFFNGTAVESAFIDTYSLTNHKNSLVSFHHFQCTACSRDCSECESNLSCKVSYTSLLRVFILGVQSFCATIVIILAATTFRLRRSKSFQTSRWIILEALLFGSLLLYISVIIQYFEPKPLNCFLVPWFRELGFGFVYGSIIIKLYRIFAEFQTRKAHRVCVRDKDLLKYLCAIILIITGYMAAWSALILETINGFSNLNAQSAEVYIIQMGRTVDNLKFYLCKTLSWDYITQLGELSFVLTGIYLSYCIRNARSEFYREKWALCTCIYIEFVISGSFYILRHFLWNSLHPDLIYLMYFIRCQFTISIILVLIFGSKIFRPPLSSNARKSRFFTGNEKDRVKDRVPENAMKLHAAILSNGELDVSDINLSEMDPDDIRSELRRVYTQLQVLKNKTIRKDNPHISKRRGGRKTHRRFSLQAFNAHNKHLHKSSHHHHQDHEQEITEVSRTPEESTASLEGPSGIVYADGQSSVLSSK